MLELLRRYARWLHTGWPAGSVERWPSARPDGTTSLPGVVLVGDLTGVPLLKHAADTGARAVQQIVADPAFQSARRAVAAARVRPGPAGVLDLVILGGGVAGMAAALEARRAGLAFVVVEASEPFSTIAGFPRRKPIFTYPTALVPAGSLQFTARSAVKEGLLQELREQVDAAGITPLCARAQSVRRRDGVLEVQLASAAGEDEPPGSARPPAALRAHRVVVALGRSGNFRRLAVPGEERDKVGNRLHDPADFAQRDVLVVGGGDSAVESAVALTEAGARVTLSYRGTELGRPKPENVDRLQRAAARRPGHLRLELGTQVRRIGERDVELRDAAGRSITLANDFVFTMIGREAPLDFFRRSGLPIAGEWRARTWAGLAAMLLACVFVYHWKTSAGLPVHDWFQQQHWFPFNLRPAADARTLAGTLQIAMGQPSFYYSLAYSAAVMLFGIRRIRHRRTPYVTTQTWTLIAIQVIPLFLLPYVILPWAGHNGAFDSSWLADQLFPRSQWDAQGREYWRALGLVLAWPLFLWNVFTGKPLVLWLAISLVQTFVVIPLIVWKWGKGAYCGWICSCGALAETLGDAHRHKMPHGPRWNRLNLVGQGILALALLLLALRVLAWMTPWDGPAHQLFRALFEGRRPDGTPLGVPLNLLNYVWSVDLLLAGILGVGLYFHFSGRIWCRFACPLAALMHVYARFSRFRILADKQKCISCNVCTSVCHQGIDVMAFANKGRPMADVQCVRCSACVQSCPTGVLEFGAVDRQTGRLLARDRLAASPVRAREG